VYCQETRDFNGEDTKLLPREEWATAETCPQCNGETNLCNGYCHGTGLVSANSAQEWHTQNDA
jgi:hypothetical protein